ncbi:MAG: HEAT repeat domain-containing protein [Chloroflexi bacterium]|nr:HEAT repeat domain-containing protein [Chloroflexota bacterium]
MTQRRSGKEPTLGGAGRSPLDAALGGQTALLHALEHLDAEETNIRARAIQALGELGSDAAIDQLIDAARQRSGREGRRIVIALAASGHPRALEAVVQIAWDRRGDAYMRGQAMLELGATRDPQYIGLLLHFLTVPDSIDARYPIHYVARGLSYLLDDHPDRFGFLIEQHIARLVAAEVNHRDRTRSEFLFEHLRPRAAIAPLLAALRDPTLAVNQRVRVAFVIRSIGRPEASAGLLKAITETKDTWLMRAIASALGTCRDRHAIPQLIALLKDDHPTVRGQAARVLAIRKVTRALPQLLDAIDDPDPRARREIVYAALTLDRVQTYIRLVGLLEPDATTPEALAWLENLVGNPQLSAPDWLSRRLREAGILP